MARIRRGFAVAATMQGETSPAFGPSLFEMQALVEPKR